MRAAVLGHPIAHSLSPVLHRAAYAALGLSGWSYDAVDVDAPHLPAFVAAMDAGWAGLSLTMPLKEDVIPLLAGVSDLARAVGAVNTVVPVDPRGVGARAAAWFGENTDVHGILAALAEAGLTRADTAVVLGGGATAASALAALARLGVHEPVVCARSRRRSEALEGVARRLGVAPRFAPWPSSLHDVAELSVADVVISTVPAGAADELAADIGAAGARPRGALLDVAYGSRPNALLAAWRAQGGAGVDGTVMLLHQAAEQVRWMTGRRAPLEEMRQALRVRHAPAR